MDVIIFFAGRIKTFLPDAGCLFTHHGEVDLSLKARRVPVQQ